MERMLLVSSDCHASPLVEDFRPYLEERFHADLDAEIDEQQRVLEERRAQMAKGGSIQLQSQADDYDARARYAVDMEFRIQANEEMGYASELIFPDGKVGNRIPFSGRFICSVGPRSLFPDQWTAGLRAYNRWLGEHCVPERHIGVGLVSFHDPQYALEQVKGLRALGLRSAMPQWDPLDPEFLPLHDAAFDPVWAACVEEHLPISFHPNAGRPRDAYHAVDDHDVYAAAPYVDYRSTQGAMLFETEDMFWSRRTLWQMVMGGVLERHPELRVGFLEMYTDWIPRTLKRLDYLISNSKGRSSRWEDVCPLLASEYFQRQCFVGSGAIWSEAELAMIPEIGVETIAYGPDFPHGPSPWYRVKPFVRSTLGAAKVAEPEARLMLGENMARIFELDLDKLAPVVERIGPLPEEVLVPSDDGSDRGQLTAYVQFATEHRESTSVG